MQSETCLNTEPGSSSGKEKENLTKQQILVIILMYCLNKIKIKLKLKGL